jgi:hypothetical protein
VQVIELPEQDQHVCAVCAFECIFECLPVGEFPPVHQPMMSSSETLANRRGGFLPRSIARTHASTRLLPVGRILSFIGPRDPASSSSEPSRAGVRIVHHRSKTAPLTRSLPNHLRASSSDAQGSYSVLIVAR